jgi:hypothetical protein
MAKKEEAIEAIEAIELQNDALKAEVTRLNTELAKKAPVAETETVFEYEGKSYAIVCKGFVTGGKYYTAAEAAVNPAIVDELVQEGALVREI